MKCYLMALQVLGLDVSDEFVTAFLISSKSSLIRFVYKDIYLLCLYDRLYIFFEEASFKIEYT